MKGVRSLPKSLEQRRFGLTMSSRPGRAVFCVLALMVMSLSPLVVPAAAHESILLTVDVQHAVLEPGQSMNITLTVENNGSSIEDYNITVDDAGLASPWTVIVVDETLGNVFPTWSKNTTLVVRLAEGATVADSGSFTVNVTEPDNGAVSMLTVLATVAPAYHPSLSVSGSPLVHMAAGSSTNVSFTAHNLGSVTDTFLLDVEVQPDLASWWANHTNTSTGNNSGGSGNSTDNSSDDSGDDTSGNQSDSNGTNTSTSLSMLMMGNSYTSANSLASLVEDVLDADGYNATVDTVNGGGMKLPAHWQNVNTSGNQWNTTLRSSVWDYVVLQDQSQVPSFPTSNSMWQDSKNASISLSNAVEEEGAETVLFMTWGYRDGDSLNSFNNNFTSMQERLLEGYTRYAENISAAGHAVWMAPVGLAYKTVHDNVVAQGVDPTTSGNLFYDLYSSDGSHPSLAGSYLAACVFHSTTTGETCVGSNATVSLNATTQQALQEAADDTVFNQTSGMSYYPWEASGTTAFGLGSSVPQGWYIQWQDDELANIPAGGSTSATLSITVPADAAPDFYGYRLTIGSTNGNITSSTVIVVEVEADASASTAFLRQDDVFLPGQSTVTGVQVTNTGNSVLDLEWELSLPPTTGSSPCTGALSTAQTLGLQPNDVAEVSILVDVDESVDSSAQCTFLLTVFHDAGDSVELLDTLQFTINVDEAVAFVLVGPLNVVDILPEVGSNYEVRVVNNGSDEATFFLDVSESTGLDTVLVSSSGVTVAAGEAGTWTVNSKGDSALSGVLHQSFSTTYKSQTASLLVPINLLEVDNVELVPPSEDRTLVSPGGTSNMDLILRNTGTSNLTFTPTLSGLPSDVDAAFNVSEVHLERGAEQAVSITFVATTGASPATSPLVLTYTAGSFSVDYAFSLVVVDREEVMLSALQQRLLASPATSSSMTVDVVNVGTATEMYLVDWSTENDGSWFTFTISPTTFELEAGSTQQLSITVQEVSSGAPSDGVPYALTVSSTSNPSVADTLNITIEPVLAGATIDVYTDVGSAKPGGTVYGTLKLTNTGSGEDTFSIASVGVDCGLDASITVPAGQPSEELGWSCTVANDAAAGLRSVAFRAVSSVRSNVVIEVSELYTVEAEWPGDSRVSLAFEDGKISLGVDSSTTTVLTVQNLGNAEVSGTLDTSGQDTGLILVNWTRMSDNVETTDFTLTSGSSIEFLVKITSNTARSAALELTVRATSTGGGVLKTDQSVPLPISLEGPALPPNGLALPLGVNVAQSTALGVMGAGWLLAIVAIQLLRRRPSVSSKDSGDEDASEDEADEKDLPELGYNECRLDGESKVNCPSCDARLGVPRGSTPPFRFTCPQCGSKIRVVE